MEELSSFRNRVEALGRSSSVLGGHEADEVCRVAWALQRHMSAEMSVAIQADSSSPILRVYMSDGWAVTLDSTRNVTWGDGARFARSGKARIEFLAEKDILRYFDAEDRQRAIVMLRPPTPMQGKSGWHVFAHSMHSRCLW